MIVWIVYAHTSDGCRFALKAYGTKDKADQHIRRCIMPMYEDPNSSSPADVLGFSAMTCEPLTVED